MHRYAHPCKASHIFEPIWRLGRERHHHLHFSEEFGNRTTLEVLVLVKRASDFN
jgi:hypothetical protein